MSSSSSSSSSRHPSPLLDDALECDYSFPFLVCMGPDEQDVSRFLFASRRIPETSWMDLKFDPAWSKIFQKDEYRQLPLDITDACGRSLKMVSTDQHLPFRHMIVKIEDDPSCALPMFAPSECFVIRLMDKTNNDKYVETLLPIQSVHKSILFVKCINATSRVSIEGYPLIEWTSHKSISDDDDDDLETHKWALSFATFWAVSKHAVQLHAIPFVLRRAALHSTKTQTPPRPRDCIRLLQTLFQHLQFYGFLERQDIHEFALVFAEMMAHTPEPMREDIFASVLDHGDMLPELIPDISIETFASWMLSNKRLKSIGDLIRATKKQILFDISPEHILPWFVVQHMFGRNTHLQNIHVNYKHDHHHLKYFFAPRALPFLSFSTNGDIMYTAGDRLDVALEEGSIFDIFNGAYLEDPEDRYRLCMFMSTNLANTSVSYPDMLLCKNKTNNFQHQEEEELSFLILNIMGELIEVKVDLATVTLGALQQAYMNRMVEMEKPIVPVQEQRWYHAASKTIFDDYTSLASLLRTTTENKLCLYRHTRIDLRISPSLLLKTKTERFVEEFNLLKDSRAAWCRHHPWHQLSITVRPPPTLEDCVSSNLFECLQTSLQQSFCSNEQMLQIALIGPDIHKMMSVLTKHFRCPTARYFPIKHLELVFRLFSWFSEMDVAENETIGFFASSLKLLQTRTMMISISSTRPTMFGIASEELLSAMATILQSAHILFWKLCQLDDLLATISAHHICTELAVEKEGYFVVYN